MVDGDTVKVKLASGAKKTIRLIGIDTPETRKPATPIECGGPEATDALEDVAFDSDGRGKAVVLDTDETQDVQDHYGRALAYVKTVGGKDIGKHMLGEGWASVYVYNNHPFQKVAAYQRASDGASAAALGVFGLCAGDFHSAQ